MVTITNGHMTLTVPTSAFVQVYQASGFHVLADEKDDFTSDVGYTTPDVKTPSTDTLAVETTESELAEDYDPEDEVEVDLSEIPLSEMDFYQLCEYADQLGLDRRGMRSKKELRALIKNNT